MIARHAVQHLANLPDHFLLDVTEKLQSQMNVRDLRPRHFHASMRAFQPRLCGRDGVTNLLRYLNRDEREDHFFSNSRRNISNAFCDAKNLNVSRSKISIWRF